MSAIENDGTLELWEPQIRDVIESLAGNSVSYQRRLNEIMGMIEAYGRRCHDIGVDAALESMREKS